MKRGNAEQSSESMFFVIGIPFCFVLPCFGAGCHTFCLKIATAALRPRNDTKLERFYLENRRFSFFAVIFLRGAALHRFSNISFRKLFRFPAKPAKFVIARRVPLLRPTRQSLTMRFVIPKRTMVGRNETEPWNEERGSGTMQRIHVFCDRNFFLLRAPVLRHGMPYL